jgi:glycosyltransferase involved in cell wall biosynthesis
MNCLNGADFLSEAMDSVYSQTMDDWEVIFWDNGSSDGSMDIAASYGTKVRLYRSDLTEPLGAARNKALSQARGEFIAFLDTDDLWMPTKLERQLELFRARPRVGLVHADVVCLRQADGSRLRHFSRLRRKPPRGMIFGYLLRENVISMPSVVLRATALRSQDEWFDPQFEIFPDFDLFRRIAHDWECDYVDEPLACYRIHAKSSSSRNYVRAAGELQLSIDKFRRLFPEIDSHFAHEMALLEAMVAFQRGKSLWRDKRGRDARKEFACHLKYTKVSLAWLCSWLPYTVVDCLLNQAWSLKARTHRPKVIIHPPSGPRVLKRPCRGRES